MSGRNLWSLVSEEKFFGYENSTEIRQTGITFGVTERRIVVNHRIATKIAITYPIAVRLIIFWLNPLISDNTLTHKYESFFVHVNSCLFVAYFCYISRKYIVLLDHIQTPEWKQNLYVNEIKR